MSTTCEYPQLLEIDVGKNIQTVTFTANGEHLVCGHSRVVEVRRVKDGQLVATMPMENGAFCVGASRDGRFIAAGTNNGEVFVWDATTYEQIFATDGNGPKSIIWDVDFSQDSARLVLARDGHYKPAVVWDIVACEEVQVFNHYKAKIAKYSLQGDRIATASWDSVRVWDSGDWRLLIALEAGVGYSPLWSNNHLFVKTNLNTIRKIDTSTWSIVSEWPVHSSDAYAPVVVPRHGKFVASYWKKTITFSTLADRSSPIQHTWDISSIACSSNGQFLAITTGSRITVKDISSLSSRVVSVPVESKVILGGPPPRHSVFRSLLEPEIDIDATALNAWQSDQLAHADALLSAEISAGPENSAHHVYASRALVLTRLGRCDAALVDADKSIKARRSVIGYIAKCVALVGKGEKDEGIRVCDIAFVHFHPEYVIFLLLLKAVVLSMTGDHVDAISRMDDLITDSVHTPVDPALYQVQAYMHLLHGIKLMESTDYDRAIRSFEDAWTKLDNHTCEPPLLVTLISGWRFGDLAVTIQKYLCEALLAGGRAKEACERMMHMSDEEVDATKPTESWVSDFKYRCRGKLEDLGDNAVNARRYDEAISLYTAALSLDPTTPQDLLVKRSNAYIGKDAREDALSDAKEWARLTLIPAGSWEDALAAAVSITSEGSSIHRAVCEHLEATGRIIEAVACFHRMSNESKREMGKEEENWACDFKSRCRSKLEDLGDSAANAKQYDEAISQYTVAMTLEPAGQKNLLMKRSNAQVSKGAELDALNDGKEWARLMLMSSSWEDAMAAAVGFTLDIFMIYRVVCEHLEMIDRVMDAVACFHQMSNNESTRETDKDRLDWAGNFKSRCRRKLEDLGDNAMNANRYDDAGLQYTAALSLDPASTSQSLLVKRSKAYAEQGEWENALDDANDVIKLDPSSSLGYERKHAALLGMERHGDAIDAFSIMLSKMSQSADPEIRERSRGYVRPEQTNKVIRASIQNAIRNSPSVLINASSGCLCNKPEQAAAFESTPAFMTLIASMTTYIDHALIKKAVEEFYRYATLSHTWEGNEPLYETVIKTVVYDLTALPTHNKLQMFCQIARDEGFHWAWSDTCCINKGDQIILQEALVSMFRWYEGSALTIIFLCDVDGVAEVDALMNSLWNSRGWTLQEYHASKVVRIYTKDWTPYLGLTIPNHKESPEIISEMERATGISAESLKALRPGLKNIREKLHLASTRQTARVEDAAYSLLGIFSMTLPATYGEGDKALGRLLSQLLTSSGDTSILAWTGISGSFNSCLPAEIIVFNQPLTSHVPPAIPDAEMATITSALDASSLDQNLVTTLYDRLNALSLPSFSVQRMKLPCIAFEVKAVVLFRKGPVPTFRAQAGALGAVRIRTKQNIEDVGSLYLVHPWIDFLLDRHAIGDIVDIAPHEDQDVEDDESSSSDSFLDEPTPLDADPLDGALRPSATAPRMDARMEFLARLTKPFGALLLAPTRRNVPEYRRIATENVITVQVQEMTSATLNMLIEGVRLLDVL